MTLTTVATFPELHQAELARSVLEANDIQVMLADDNVVGLHPLAGPAIGGVRLQVAEQDAEEARSILVSEDGVDDDQIVVEDGSDLTCSTCGSVLPDPSAECEECAARTRPGKWPNIPSQMVSEYRRARQYLWLGGLLMPLVYPPLALSVLTHILREYDRLRLSDQGFRRSVGLTRLGALTVTVVIYGFISAALYKYFGG